MKATIHAAILKKPASANEIHASTGFRLSAIREAMWSLERAGKAVQVGTLPSLQGSPRKVWAGIPAVKKANPRLAHPRAIPATPASIFHFGALLNWDKQAWDAVNDSFYRRSA